VLSREYIKAVTPNAILDLFRIMRRANRNRFKAIRNRKSANIYKSLILKRFPDLENATKDSYVLDLGANIGSFTQACVELGMKVKSVEPHPDAFKYLRNRTKNLPGVSLYQLAVSNQTGKIKLFTHPQQKNDPITTSVSASVVVDKFKNHSGHYEVSCATLEIFFREDTCYEIVKIDIEGAEMYLVEQLIENAHKIKRLLVETHERFMNESETADEYQNQIQKLEKYIRENKLERVWLTDWI
jgi:FkbM family methyltransferase